MEDEVLPVGVDGGAFAGKAGRFEPQLAGILQGDAGGVRRMHAVTDLDLGGVVPGVGLLLPSERALPAFADVRVVGDPGFLVLALFRGPGALADAHVKITAPFAAECQSFLRSSSCSVCACRMRKCWPRIATRCP